MAKVKQFNPEAIDGDADGLVQDGTEFERPVAPEGFMFAQEGDNYAVIADRLGVDAVALWKLNYENPIYPGTLLRKK
jgi:hypothetical protein